MKHTSKHNAGFTLVELVVAMAIAVIVTAAASSVLLMGVRVNRQTADTASKQLTVRALLNVLEKAAADGNISEVESDVIIDENQKEYGSWMLKGEDGSAIFRYDVDTQTIYTNEVAVLEGVYASNAIMEGQLLSISIETKDGTYTSSVYCRTAESVASPDVDTLPGDTTNSETDPRKKFIEILKSQYRSRGEIRNGDGKYTYYSEWYIGLKYDAPGYEGKWNAKTPWCACYVSWALSQVSNQITNPPADRAREIMVWDEQAGAEIAKQEYFWYANVDDFLAYFQNNGWMSSAANGGDEEPQPGDLIFFDWDRGIDPEHVGVVLKVEKRGDTSIVYTIEGNSAGRVTIRNYSINDERIIGYGVIFPN